MSQRKIYIFLDEGGNLDFRPEGSRYFFLTCVTMERPFLLYTTLDSYKYDLIEYGIEQEYFHCANDNPYVRTKMFNTIYQSLEDIKVDTLIVEKCKTGPALREDKVFYPKMLGYLLQYVIKQCDPKELSEVLVVTDTIPINKKRKAIEKSIKSILADMLPKDIQYRIIHHSSKAHYGLQIADYCNWAVSRKWERNDTEHYEKIKPSLQSEFDIFKTETTKYY